MALVVVAVAVGALSKGLTGLGLPLLAIPVIAVFLDVRQAVIVMAFPTFVTNAWLVWSLRRHLPETRHLGVMLATGAVGAIAGAGALSGLDPDVPRVAVGTLIVVYLVMRLARPSLTLSPTTLRRSAPGVGLVGGVMQGATGMSGSLLATYLHGANLPPAVFVLSLTALFTGFAAVQVGTFAAVGGYTRTTITGTLLALLPIAVAFPVGIRLGRTISPDVFERLLTAILLVVGARLLQQGISGLLAG